MINDLKIKQSEQQKIDAMKAEFFKKGGKVEEIPYLKGQPFKTKEELTKNSWREEGLK